MSQRSSRTLTGIFPPPPAPQPKMPTLDESRWYIPGPILNDLNRVQGRVDDLAVQLRQLSYAIGQYRLGDPTGVQTAATALIVLSRKIYPAYVEVIRKFYRVPSGDDSVRRNEDKVAVKLFITALSQFVSAVRHLVELCAQDEKPEAPHKEMKVHLKYWEWSVRGMRKEFLRGDPRIAHLFCYSMLSSIENKIGLLADDIIPQIIYRDIPRLRAVQAHYATHLDNVSTLAGLLAASVATMLQLSVGVEGPGRPSAVLILWYISLVASITCGITSVLGRSWTSAVIKYSSYSPPVAVSIWMERGPILILSLAVAAFFAGLSLYVYVIDQGTTVAIVTSAFCAVCFLIASLSLCFVFATWNLAHVTRQMFSFVAGRLWVNYVTKRWRPKLVRDRNSGHSVENNNIQIVTHSPPSLHNTDPENALTPTLLAPADDKILRKNSPQESHHARDRWGRFRERWRQSWPYIRELERRNRMSDISDANSYQKARAAVMALQESDSFKKNTIHKALIKSLRFTRDGSSLLSSSWDHACVAIPVQGNSLNLRAQLRFEHLPEYMRPADKLEWSPSGESILQLHREGGISVWSRGGPGETDFPKKLVATGRGAASPVRSAAWMLREGHEAILSIEGDMAIQNEPREDGTWERWTPFHVDSYTIRDTVTIGNGQWMICIGDAEYVDRRSTADAPAATENAGYRFNSLRIYSTSSPHILWRATLHDLPSHLTLSMDEKAVLISYDHAAPPELWEIIIPTSEPAQPGSQGNETSAAEVKTRAPSLRLKHVFVVQLRGDRFAKLPCLFGGPEENLVLRAAAARRTRSAQTEPSTNPDVEAVQDATRIPTSRGQATDAALSQPVSWWKRLLPGVGFARASGTAALHVVRKAQEALLSEDSNPAAHPVPPHIFCWERDTGVLLYCIDFPLEYGNITAFAWNPAEDASMLVVGTEDGDIYVWSESPPAYRPGLAPSLPVPEPISPDPEPSIPSGRRRTLRRS